MGDGTADGVRVDSLAEWQAAAEEVRRLERVAQGKRETLLSAARADALAQGELGAGRRLLAGLERALVEGTALAGPATLSVSEALRRVGRARGDDSGGELMIRPGKIERFPDPGFDLPPATGWQSDKLAPRSTRDPDAVTEIFTVHPEPGAQVRMDDSPEAISAANEAGRTASIETVTSAPMPDAPSTDYYANLVKQHINFVGSLTQHADGRVETTGPTKLKMAVGAVRYPGIADIQPKPDASPADYWSGAARNPRRWWQVWRKK